jgi:murein DD-endopeptidase MepM/ murein hydrolase activator NlpD
VVTTSDSETIVRKVLTELSNALASVTEDQATGAAEEAVLTEPIAHTPPGDTEAPDAGEDADESEAIRPAVLAAVEAVVRELSPNQAAALAAMFKTMGGQPGEAARATPKPQPLKFFPVRGKHNTGWDSNAGKPATWTCNNEHSNSDFVPKGAKKSHLGIDIWAKEGTSVVATVSGTISQAGWSDYSGN